MYYHKKKIKSGLDRVIKIFSKFRKKGMNPKDRKIHDTKNRKKK